MRLHAIYRSTPGENRKSRPEYFGKLGSLLSFLRAWEACPDAGELIFLNNGEPPPERLDLMRARGELRSLPGLPLEDSYARAVENALERGWDADDLVYFAEDDYLYEEVAFRSLHAAAHGCPAAHYLALYASVDGRLPNGEPLHEELRSPPPRPGLRPVEAEGRGWREGLSHTSSFAVRLGALREDARLHWLAPRTGLWWDHAICLLYQGRWPYRNARLAGELLLPRGGPLRERARIAVRRAQLLAAAAPRRRVPHRLLAAVPALATHVEVPYLAAGTDWGAVHRDTRRWAEERVA